MKVIGRPSNVQAAMGAKPCTRIARRIFSGGVRIVGAPSVVIHVRERMSRMRRRRRTLLGSPLELNIESPLTVKLA